MALLVLRATPLDIHLPYPAELLYGRRVVSNLPIATWNASGERCEIRARLDQRQATPSNAMTLVVYSRTFTRTTRPYTSPNHSDVGTCRIVEKCQQPRSYKVESASGSVVRVIRRDIHETAEKHVFLTQHRR